MRARITMLNIGPVNSRRNIPKGLEFVSERVHLFLYLRGFKSTKVWLENPHNCRIIGIWWKDELLGSGVKSFGHPLV